MAAGRHLGKLQWHRAVSLQQHGFLVAVGDDKKQESLANAR